MIWENKRVAFDTSKNSFISLKCHIVQSSLVKLGETFYFSERGRTYALTKIDLGSILKAKITRRIFEMDDLAKVKHLIEHWIEHTQEHAEEFENWAKKIENLEGGKELSQALKKAVQNLKEVINILSPYKP
ncbi:MAG: hypothetical protein NZ530_03880 [Thermodesulfobacteriaceae bacterium]|nr:hypothetical protein [Thermodesulfobacteriaceae bacterium]